MVCSKAGLLLLLTLVSLGQVSGHDVILRLTTLSQGQSPSRGQAGCHLPNDLDIEMSSPGIPLPDELTSLPRSVHLVRHDARHSVRQVRVIQKDGRGRFYLETVQLDTPENEEVERYYNHEIGVTLTVRCAHDDWIGATYSAEGSMFIKGVKYLFRPSTSLRFERFRDSLTLLIQLTRTDEHNAEDSAWKQVSPSYSQQQTQMAPDNIDLSSRTKRETLSYHIDLLPVVDYSVYNRWPKGKSDNDTLKEITDYISNILTSINMRLDSLSLETRKIKVHLIEPIFSKSDALSPWNNGITEKEGNDTKINATKLLTAFKDWLSQSSTTISKYDHAFLLTAYDIYGGNDQGIRYNVTKGLAYISSICNTNGESSSIIEDKGGYQSEGVLAHELGHSLGASHDGANNTCLSTDRFLMSDSNYQANMDNARNPWKFSNCSSEAILSRLKALENSTTLKPCLTQQIGRDVNLTSTKNANDQCTSIYGNESFACRGEGIANISTFCQDFYCRVPKRDTCERITAATGTCCGNQEKCDQGVCIGAASGECLMDADCPLGDQPGVIIDGLSCAANNPSNCYSTNYRLKCCKTCKAAKTNDTGCDYGDKVLGCNSTLCGGKDSNGNSYDFFCCKTCSSVPPQDNPTVNDTGNLYTCPEFVRKYNASVCNNPITHGIACPVTCETVRDKDNKGCPWGDKNNCSALAGNPTHGFVCDAGQKVNCCRTCADFNATSTTVTTTTSTSTSTSTKTTTTTTTTRTSTPAKGKTCSPSPCAACSVYNVITSLAVTGVCLCLTHFAK